MSDHEQNKPYEMQTYEQAEFEHKKIWQVRSGTVHARQII